MNHNYHKLNKQLDAVESGLDKVKEVLDSYNKIVDEANLNDLRSDLFHEVLSLRNIINVAQDRQKQLKTIYEEALGKYKLNQS